MPRAPLAASFRDPSGFIYEEDGVLLRQINPIYEPHWRRFLDSGLYENLRGDRLIIPHDQIAPGILRPDRLDFVSYPYEWSFGQLKDSALLTLDLQSRALGFGMWLKDASAYNIQKHQDRLVLIDSLSFEIYEEGRPWPAYRQFCEHFLSPLALMSLVDIRLGRLQREYIDGVPIDLAAGLLPGRTKLNPGFAIHVHAHARAQSASGGQAPGQPTGKVSKTAILGMIDNLRSTVERLDWKPEGTTWANYYAETNYSDDSFKEKHRLVGEMLGSITPAPKTAWDLGANTGEFSAIAAQMEIPTVSWDIDPGAVERNYRVNKKNSRIYPLLLDLTNPSPGTGWANRERDSFSARGPAGVLLALALLHHLAIGNNVPLYRVAEYFADLSPWAIVEFVPKADSQVQRLLATRTDIYDSYSQAGLEAAFETYFEILRKESIPGSERTLYLFRRHAR